MMEFRFVHLFPDLMNLYGSYANLSILTRLFSALGHTVGIIPVGPGETPPLDDADLVYMGAGTERARTAALAACRPFGEALAAAFAGGLPLLFAGTAMELLGKEIVLSDGEAVPGLALAGFTSTEGKTRLVGDVLGTSPLSAEPVVGYMNKCTQISGVDSPLLTSLSLGFGNERTGGPEGWHEKNGFGSELTGPLLMKNPALLTAVAEAILTRGGVPLPDSWPIDPHAAAGHLVTVQERSARCESR